MPNEEHTAQVPHEECMSTTELQEELNDIWREAQEAEETEPIEFVFVVFLMAASALVGIYATRWFGTWPAQLAGGLTIAVLAFSGVTLALYAIENIVKRVRGEANAE